MIEQAKSSRLPGFYNQTLAERGQTVAAWAGLSAEARAALDGTGGLTPGPPRFRAMMLRSMRGAA